jgi:hypothetical protein
MNYPVALQNPQLERFKPRESIEFRAFNNLDRPVSHPVKNLYRPFTGNNPSGKVVVKSAMTKNTTDMDIAVEIKALY